MNIKSQNIRQITRLNTNAHRDIPIIPWGTHAHTRGMIPCISVLSQVIYYTYKTNVQSDKKKRKKQGDGAAYTSSRVPCSLFKTAWLCWMYQLSNMQQVMVQHLRLADGHVFTCPKRGTEIDEDLLCQNISKTRF